MNLTGSGCFTFDYILNSIAYAGSSETSWGKSLVNMSTNKDGDNWFLDLKEVKMRKDKKSEWFRNNNFVAYCYCFYVITASPGSPWTQVTVHFKLRHPEVQTTTTTNSQGKLVDIEHAGIITQLLQKGTERKVWAPALSPEWEIWLKLLECSGLDTKKESWGGRGEYHSP